MKFLILGLILFTSNYNVAQAATVCAGVGTPESNTQCGGQGNYCFVDGQPACQANLVANPAFDNPVRFKALLSEQRLKIQSSRMKAEPRVVPVTP